MGDWRTVSISGSCPAGQLAQLREATLEPHWSGKDGRKYHCLIESDGLAGLGNWTGEEISADGNLYERNFTVDDVAAAVTYLASAAPGLELIVHCGDNWESHECVATVRLLDGRVTVGAPEVAQVAGASEEAMMSNLYAHLNADS